jgi:hypothetical protein
VSFRLERGQNIRVKAKHNTVQEQVLTLNQASARSPRHGVQVEALRMIPLQVCEVIIEKRLANRTVRAFFQACPTTSGIIGLRPSNDLLMPKARSTVGVANVVQSTHRPPS